SNPHAGLASSHTVQGVHTWTGVVVIQRRRGTETDPEVDGADRSRTTGKVYGSALGYASNGDGVAPTIPGARRPASAHQGGCDMVPWLGRPRPPFGRGLMTSSSPPRAARAAQSSSPPNLTAGAPALAASDHGVM